MRADGRKSVYLGRVAETTFDDLLRLWVGPDHPEPGRISPDVQKVDIRHAMPSLSKDLGDIVLSWQVKGTRNQPPTVSSPVVRCEALRCHLGTRYVRDLLDAAAEGRALYLVLGIAKCEAADLLNHPPIDRFVWYAVDMTQYRLALGGEDPPGHVDIPLHNRLNLGLFSLIWASRWVDQFFVPLRRDEKRPDSVVKLLKTFDLELGQVGADAIERSREAIAGLQDLGEYMPGPEHRLFAERLVIVGSLRAISAQLLLSDGADQIRTYSPEALAGTVSLWLFSRTYHEFMRTTRAMADINQRFLPLNADSIKERQDKFFVAALLLVREFYRKLGARVEVVKMLPEGGREDHADFSGALKAFSWVSVDGDGGIQMSEAHLSATEEDREVLEEAQGRMLSAVGISLSDWGGFGGLSFDDMRLELAPPTMLFPPEDRFLSYPKILWTQGARGFAL